MTLAVLTGSKRDAFTRLKDTKSVSPSHHTRSSVADEPLLILSIVSSQHSNSDFVYS